LITRRSDGPLVAAMDHHLYREQAEERNMMLRRALLALSVTAAAGVLPLVTATSAQASPADCRNYLANQGYEVGPKVTKACSYNSVSNNWKCVTQLAQLISNTTHINVACTRALGD
jgi:hypothetical protein